VIRIAVLTESDRKVLHAPHKSNVYIEQMSSRSDMSAAGRWFLPALLVFALVIRVLYLLNYSDLPQWDQLTVDNYYHHHWAENLAGGNILGDTTYFRAPFYIYILGLVYTLFGASLWAARLFGMVVGLASIYCTYRIGRQAFSHQVGLVAAAVQSINPVFLYFEAELLLDRLALAGQSQTGHSPFGRTGHRRRRYHASDRLSMGWTGIYMVAALVR
jgi:hypothetical protein